MPRVCQPPAVGPSGGDGPAAGVLGAAKALLGAGLDVVVYERNAEVGGNGIFKPGASSSSVFEATAIISSKALSEHERLPMPADRAIQRQLERPDYAFPKTPRHAVELDFHEFRQRLERELAGRRAF